MLRIQLQSGALSDKFRHVSEYQSSYLNTGQIVVDIDGHPVVL